MQADPQFPGSPSRQQPASTPAITASVSLWHVAAAVTIVVAAVVRLWAAQGDLWLDEIWTCAFVSMIDGPWKVFTEIRHDNNHHLISLWIHFLGNEVPSLIVRAPSIFAGVGTLLLAAACARRWGLRTMLLATVLTGSSYVMINYSAEARGYALVGFLALAAFLTLDQHLATRGWYAAGLFGVLCALGFLSHLTFLHFYIGALAWSAVRLAKESSSWRGSALAMLRCHLLPILFVVGFYFVSLRGMEIGGGESPDVLRVIVKALATAVGGPTPFSGNQMVIALLAAAGGIVALVMLARTVGPVDSVRGDDLFVAFVSARAATGIWFVRAVLLRQHRVLSAARQLLARPYRQRRQPGRRDGHAASTVDDCRQCRAIARVHARSARRVSVRGAVHHRSLAGTADCDRRGSCGTRLVLHFFSAYTPPGRALVYGGPASRPAATDEWYIAHIEREGLTPVAAIQDAAGRRFELANVCRHAGLSGFDWAVYHRVEPATAQPTR